MQEKLEFPPEGLNVRIYGCMGRKYFKEKRIVSRILVARHLQKRSLGRIRRRCAHILKMDMSKTDFTDISFNSGSFAFAAFDVNVIF
jgi:hypothetical protein